MLEKQIEMLAEITIEKITGKKLEIEEDKESSQEDENTEFITYRLENLLERRPFLLSHVILRQNPNNVYEWINLARLCEVYIFE